MFRIVPLARELSRAFRFRTQWLLLALALISGSVSAQTFKVLVFSKTVGTRHASIPDGILAIQQLGAANGFQVDTTEDSALINASNLPQYAAVIFLNTSGDVLTDTQQTAFQNYLHSGKGFVGVHSAADTERGWPWYGQMLGTWQQDNPSGTAQATVKVTDRKHPSSSPLPERWVHTDEYYNFSTNPKGTVHVLAWIDETSAATYFNGTPTTKMGYDHPISWCKDFEGGRVWYTGLGHTPESYTEQAFRDHLLGGIRWAAGAVAGDAGATIWSKWEKTVLDVDSTSNPLNEPVALDIAPDGRIFYIERTTGRLNLFNQTTSTKKLVHTFSVNSSASLGLIGVAVDPDFATNNWLYLAYSKAGDDVVVNIPREGNKTLNVLRLARFTMVGDDIDMGSEQVLLTVPAEGSIANHMAGDIEFGPGRMLFWSLGDNSAFSGSPNNGYCPIDERVGNYTGDAQRTAANSNDLRGKILRIHVNSDGTTNIPSGNLFPVGTANTRPEIYVMGCRNPYRICVDQRTGWLYWGEVGPDATSDSSTRGPKGYDEFNQAKTPGYYGWPYGVANQKAYRDYDFATAVAGSLFNLVTPVNQSPNNTGITNLPAARSAWIWYPYSTGGTPSPDWPEMTPINVSETGRAAMAGCVYNYSPTGGSPKKMPAYYDNTLLVFDFDYQHLREIKLDSNGDILKINELLPSSTFGAKYKEPIDLKVGPDGALYMLEYGDGWRGVNAGGRLVRFGYTAGNRSPTAIISANPTSGSVPLTVNFSSAGSSDPDGDALTYQWDFDSNGTVDSTLANPTYTYQTAGSYVARLTLRDAIGNQSIANLPISVGNTAPALTIQQPVEGGFYHWGDSVPYSVLVTDAEDGSTASGSNPLIPGSRVNNSTALGHDSHTHNTGQFTGTTGVFEVEASGHDGTQNLFYAFSSDYTDLGGVGGTSPLQAIGGVRLNPSTQEAEYSFDSSGTDTQDTADPLGGALDVTDIDDGDYLIFDPVNFLNISAISYRVATGGLGGRIEAHLDTITGPLLHPNIQVPATGSWANYTDLTTNITDPGGVHRLYLVFRRNSGDQDLFYLNSFTVYGNGVSIPQSTTPSAPANLTIDGSIRNRVVLTWIDTASNESGFVIERKIGIAGTYQQVGTALSGTNQFSMNGLTGGQEYFFRVRAVNAIGSSAYSNEASLTVSPWLDRDIGSVNSLPGSVSYNSSTGVDTVSGAGDDIWGTADGLHYLYLTMSGDGEISARIVNIPNVNPYAKAGVMFREPGAGGTFPAGARNAYMAVTYSNGTTFQSRHLASNTTTSLKQAGLTAPYWVKLIRSGNVVTGYRSPDGITWTLQSSHDFLASSGSVLPSAMLVGIAVTAHNTDNATKVLNASTVDNIKVISYATLPIVTITAPTPNAGESGANQQPYTGQFLLSRTGATSGPLKINLTIGGTASPGMDYTALPVSVTIPAASSSSPVTVTPIKDSVVEGNETVNLSLVADTSYTLGSPSANTVTILDSPFDGWRSTYFTSSELADSSISGPYADPDRDGWMNLMEYSLGTNPKQNGEANAAPQTGTTVISNKKYMTLTYVRPIGRTDIQYQVQATNDPGGWQSAIVLAEQISSGPQPGTERVTVTDTISMDDVPKRMLRLRVTYLGN